MFYKIDIITRTGRVASYNVQKPKNGYPYYNLYRSGIKDHAIKLAHAEFGELTNIKSIDVYWETPMQIETNGSIGTITILDRWEGTWGKFC